MVGRGLRWGSPPLRLCATPQAWLWDLDLIVEHKEEGLQKVAPNPFA